MLDVIRSCGDLPPPLLAQCLLSGARVAHISRVVEGGRYCVIVRGRLNASDLNRLEYLCGPALEHRSIPLDIHLEQVTEIDAPAQVYLDRLVTRGAIVYEPNQAR